MPEAASSPVNIFISHAHDDAAWVRRLEVLLRPVSSRHNFDIVTGEDMALGQPFEEVVRESIARADVAVILISPSYVASSFIASVELQQLVSRQRSARLALVPVLVGGSFWTQVRELATLQFVVDPSRPLDGLTSVEQDEALLKIASRVVELAGDIELRRVEQSADPVEDARTSPRGDASSYTFISYSHEDGDFADLLKLKLQGHGVLARMDSDILAPGYDWQQEIDEAIRGSTATVVVISPDSRRSEYVTYEWSYALGAGRDLIPVMIRPTQLHPRLASLHYLDFTLRTSRPWEELVTAIRRLDGVR